MKKLAVFFLFGALFPCSAQTWDSGAAAPRLDLSGCFTLRGGSGWLRIVPVPAGATGLPLIRPPFVAQTFSAGEPLFGRFGIRAGDRAQGLAPDLPGSGVEARIERIEWVGASALAARPWVRTSAGIALSRHAPRPFLGVEFALPLAPGEEGGATGAKGPQEPAAPPYQIGIYGGFRF